MANEEKGFQKNNIHCLIPIYLTPREIFINKGIASF